MSEGLTGSHCVFLISVSHQFSGDFQLRLKIYQQVSITGYLTQSSLTHDQLCSSHYQSDLIKLGQFHNERPNFYLNFGMSSLLK